MTYVVKNHECHLLGLAPPFGALILAVTPRLVIPSGAKRVAVALDAWDPTTENQYFVPGSPYLAYIPRSGLPADIKIYSAQTNIYPVPSGVEEVVCVMFANPLAYPVLVTSIFEVVP